MECLVLYSAPPLRMEDFFYKPEVNGRERTPQAKLFFETLMNAAEINASDGKDETALLSEFQRRGWYAAACCECPLEDSGIAPESVAERFGVTVEKRVQHSYKPKRIALASESLEPLRKTLMSAGYRDVFSL